VVPEVLELADESRAHWTEPGRARPVRTTLWRPDSASAAPVVLLSHGTGGAVEDLAWLAEALVAEGFAVAGVDHHGNTSMEPYVAEAFAWWWDRPRDLSVVLDHLAADPRVELGRVGVAGFSLGGYTAAALLGARVAPDRLRSLLEHLELAPVPEYPGLADELYLRYGPSRIAAIAMSACRVDVSDPRVRAAFLMSPVLGIVLDPASLTAIDRPLHVVWGDDDDIAVPALGAHILRQNVPGATGASLGPVSHYAFVGDAAIHGIAAKQAQAFFARAL
jgi:predicted dienelactone hydrolase